VNQYGSNQAQNAHKVLENKNTQLIPDQESRKG
jgi:hypothetical protein